MSTAGISKNSRLSSLYIPFEEIAKDKLLGKGGFGIVYLGKWAHTAVAIKELKIEPEELSEDDQREFEREAQVMQKLRHPNIVLLYGACIQPKCCLIMEYCSRGSLSKLLKSAEQIDWTIRLKWALEIAVGLSYLHSRKILHRDLKSDNILITEQSIAKIADFGLSQIKQNTLSTLHGGMVGTVLWMAPEIINAEAGSFYTEAADIYSYAVIVWELATRKRPYSSINPNAVIARVLQGKREEIPEETPSPLKEVISGCWKQNPQQRLSLAAVIETLSIYLQQSNLSPSQLIKTGASEPQPSSPQNIVPLLHKTTALAPATQKQVLPNIFSFSSNSTFSITSSPQVIVSSIPEMAFGKSKWEKYFGDIGAEPPLSANIEQILNSPCPFWPSKKVRETHLLVLIPEKIDGKAFHLDMLEELIQSPKTGAKINYSRYPSDVKETLGTKKFSSHWILITREIIPNSININYQAQKALVQFYSQNNIFYELPTVLELTTTIAIEHIQEKGELYINNWSRCKEEVNQCPVAVRNFTSQGIDITSKSRLPKLVQPFSQYFVDIGVECCFILPTD